MTDENRYPLLTEDGKQEAQLIMNKLKLDVSVLLNNVLGDLYVDVACHIESDSWTNYRNHLMNGLTDYKDCKKRNEYDFKRIRQAIYAENKDEIIKKLNQDMVKEIEDLKSHIKNLLESRY